MVLLCDGRITDKGDASIISEDEGMDRERENASCAGV